MDGKTDMEKYANGTYKCLAIVEIRNWKQQQKSTIFFKEMFLMFRNQAKCLIIEKILINNT